MAEDLERMAVGGTANPVDASVDPMVLIVVLAMFIAGAVGPFVALFWGSSRDQSRRARAETPAEAVITNPVDPSVIPAADTVGADTIVAESAGIDSIDPPANDVVDGPVGVERTSTPQTNEQGR